jgi:hypothetical protein
MILSASQLRAIRERNDEELRKGRYAKHGYPAHLIQDLLHTIEALKKEKKKWQHLAQERGDALRRIRALTASVARDEEEVGLEKLPNEPSCPDL